MIKQAKVTTTASYAAANTPDLDIGNNNSGASTPSKIIELHFANLTVDATGAKQVTISFDGSNDHFTLSPAGCSGRAWLRVDRCLGMEKIWVKGVGSAIVEITAIA